MTALSDTDLFAALTQVKQFTPMLAQALADHISTRAKEHTALAARLAEAERLLDDAKFAPGPAAVMTEQEWWNAYWAWYGPADSAPAVADFDEPRDPRQVDWKGEPIRYEDSASPARCVHNYIEHGMTNCLICGEAIAPKYGPEWSAERRRQGNIAVSDDIERQLTGSAPADFKIVKAGED